MYWWAVRKQIVDVSSQSVQKTRFLHSKLIITVTQLIYLNTRYFHVNLSTPKHEQIVGLFVALILRSNPSVSICTCYQGWDRIWVYSFPYWLQIQGQYFYPLIISMPREKFIKKTIWLPLRYSYSSDKFQPRPLHVYSVNLPLKAYKISEVK